MAETKLTKYAEGTEEQKQFLVKIEKLNKIFSGNPDSKFVTNFQDKFNYLPISHMETLLDEYFFGHWSTTNFKYQQMINEIIGDIELVLTHPITGETIIRSGAASVQIQQKKGSELIEFTDTKIKNALVMGFPRLKAECIKNAIQSLGKLFGRDLNRKIVDNYNSLLGDEPTDELETLKRNIINDLDTYTGDNKEEIKQMLRDKEAAGELTLTLLENVSRMIDTPVMS